MVDPTENIPAFSMWKMFNETVPLLHRIEYNEMIVKRLTKTCETKEFFNIFVYNKEPTVTKEQYLEIINKYKSFTKWILGQFFYIISCKKLEKIHDVIIGAQIRILEKLSKTQLNVFNEMSSEYCKAFNMLTSYYENFESGVQLKVFTPQQSDLSNVLDLTPIYITLTSKTTCLCLIDKLMTFLKFVLSEKFISFDSFDETSKSVLDNIGFLLSDAGSCNFSIKLKIIEIFMDILSKLTVYHDDYDKNILKSVHELSVLFEETVYDVFSGNLDVGCHLGTFQEIVKEYITVSSNFCTANVKRICKFLLVYRGVKKVNDELLIISSKTVTSSDLDLDIRSVVRLRLYHLLYCFKESILREINEFLKIYEGHGKVLNVFDSVVCPTWNEFHKNILEDFSCEFFNNLCTVLIEIQLEHLHSCSLFLNFFDEMIFLKIISTLLANRRCLEISDVLSIFTNFLLVTQVNDIDVLFSFISYPFLKPLIYRSNNEIAGNTEMCSVREFYGFLETQENFDKTKSLLFLNDFFCALSLLNSNNSKITEIEKIFSKICLHILVNEHDLILLMTTSLVHTLTLFRNPEMIYSKIILNLYSIQDSTIQIEVTRLLAKIICTASSDFFKIFRIVDGKFTSEIICDTCSLNDNENCTKSQKIVQYLDSHFNNKNLKQVATISFPKIRYDLTTIEITMIKQLLGFLTSKSAETKMNNITILPIFSKHVEKFHSTNVLKVWIELLDDPDELVRKHLVQYISATIQPSLSDDNKKEIFSKILKVTKRSLQYSDFDLQTTILMTIEEISTLKYKSVLIECIKILLYFVMIPTSKYKLSALHKCFKMVEKHNTTVSIIYNDNSMELCEIIVNLCAVNQALINYNLMTSLSKVSIMFGFIDPKEFLSQESSCLLPYFVAKIVKMPAVKKLIEEFAGLIDVDISELLANKYGKIFLHIFLNQGNKNDFNQCLSYLEQQTNMTGPTLRKSNFKVIFNELLLNFNEKRERVLLALRLLAKEDLEKVTNNIPDYLQSRFLGILLYFDIQLIANTSKKQEILKSLADIFQFMGSKHITPYRFKIIAMLQTTTCDDPNLTAAVWDSFIRSCDVEFLGPQLATIFISILPLLNTCQTSINNIFKYLLLQNEEVLKEYIADLFFVNNPKTDPQVMAVIQRHLKIVDNGDLKGKLRRFLKYLTHENTDVRIEALRYIKSLMEQAREELDQMILSYNGIDPTIVELIDILTLGCREKDEGLKLACGELIGVLGAVEPSHLPQRYIQDNKSFTFFIHEDGFIVTALNELIKSFQTDNNTQNMDRFALAIQEILKAYEISPDENSSKRALWEQFPQSQKEVMLPLLSSRYKIAKPANTNFRYPIYGSPLGTSFQEWLYNWTSSLINSLPNEQKSLLQMCLPSMRQDQRILLQFLPHILLHSLLENGQILENCHTEFETITNLLVTKSNLDNSTLNVRPLRIPGIHAKQTAITPEHNMQIDCTKIVFILLDFLDRWLREWQWQKGLSGRNNEQYRIIKNFQNRFCKLRLAKCNYQCGEYPRALIYLEEYMTENVEEMSGHFTFLAEIYAQLDECDGVTGVTALQPNEPSLKQRILPLQVAGKLADAVACYERMSHPLLFHQCQGLVQCYLDLGLENTALKFLQGAIQNYELDFGNKLVEMQAEPFWRLNRWDDLRDLVQKREFQENKNWGLQIGKVLLHLKNGDRNEFVNVLNGLKLQQAEALGSASLEEGVYEYGYNYITRLHILNEIGQVENTVNDMLTIPNDRNAVEAVMKKLINELELRIKVVQKSVRVMEPLLCLRRVALEVGRNIAVEKVPQALPFFDDLLGGTWLLSSKTARLARLHQQAYMYTLKAEEYQMPTLFLEKAKLDWLREEHNQALTTLQRGFDTILTKSGRNNLDDKARKILAEGKLLFALYNDSISNVDTEMNIQYYKEAFETFKEWEKSLVFLAQYMDRVFQNYVGDDRDAKCSDIQIHLINYFGKSLQYGTKYIYQSMPRLLSIWFDYGSRLLDVTKSDVKEERKSNLLKMTKLIDTFLERLPVYIFLTAFSQLVSRICHPQREVYLELKSIIIKLLQHYPQQCLWTIMSVIKSSYPIRSKKCTEILSDIRLRTATMTKLVKDFTSLAEKLIELCNKELPQDVNSVNVSSFLRALPRMLNKGDFSEIMMPTHKFRKLVLPNTNFQSNQHNPFPNRYTHIVGIEDEMCILQSLQKPRKIVLRGSDGCGYIFMLKPKDDLRKDFRLMEFNDIVNQLLSKEAESRQRRLNIRLYSVAPLNEECGLIEWIPNLIGLRPVLMSLYKQKGLGMKGKELKEMCCNIRDPLSKKKDIFTKTLLPRHPPVLCEWFRRTFPDAQSWLTARTAYIRTTSVMSMAGYILGLGDRHGENILLDSVCGDVVHVDFNCLFNKGETFEWPERVPFRLTQNMVAAMGPLGVEGIFRTSCACTLRVLRTNVNTLMSIVTPFVYDPLVSWPRNVPATSHGNAERTNEQALEHIKNIRLRLEGVVKTRARSLSIPLSVEGQTNNLINEATNIDNLAQMYIGWGPYL